MGTVKIICRCVPAVVATLLLTACVTTNEVTGRNQFIVIPPSQDAALGAQAIGEVKKSAPIVQSGAQAERIRRIGARIAAVSDKPNFDWEFLLIDEPVLNAWALPGGKVAIYAKMAEAFPEDDMLAAVVGHEVAHAVLRHGAEQVSRQQASNAALAGLGILIGSTVEDRGTQQIALALGGMATQGLVTLPHSRFMELEADHVGTIYMARAGYDPRMAPALWRRMERLKEGAGGPPIWLSTHPSGEDRIRKLEDNMSVYLAERR